MVAVESENAPKPAIFESDQLGRIAIYLWTTTPDRSAQGRPAGEYKSQIILPGTPKGSPQHFEINGHDGCFLLGYSPLHGLFVSWQVEGHQDAGYSKNIQITEDLLEEASETGWAVAPPRRNNRIGSEVRCAVRPLYLERLLEAYQHAQREGLRGEELQTYLEAQAPDLDRNADPLDATDIAEIKNQRRLIEQRRWERCRRFAQDVLPLYDNACAACGVQLRVVEAAHLVPVYDERSQDEAWNGIALCRNHHKLFDSKVWYVDRDLTFRVDDAALRVLTEHSLDRGIDQYLLPYRDKILKNVPSEWGSDDNFRARMRESIEIANQM
ncbi:HNH endonuclease [Gilvimarinus sp. F26214L]|uniref:HNH endonuclease n=1 Tax=Gilvimarinus sp. DZF01 TaxID=3461371 RepID=UPI004045D6C0